MIESQLIIEFVRREPTTAEHLDDLADAALSALNAHARFVAFGPVVSVDYERSAVEVECTVCSKTEGDAESKIERITSTVRDALAASDYATSTEMVTAEA